MLPELWHGPVIEVRNRVVRRKMRLATLPLAHPLKVLTRLPWTPWLSIIVLAVWCLWAFDSATHYVAPGLLDDGTFITRGLRYVQSGYFNLVLSDLRAALSSIPLLSDSTSSNSRWSAYMQICSALTCDIGISRTSFCVCSRRVRDFALSIGSPRISAPPSSGLLLS